MNSIILTSMESRDFEERFNAIPGTFSLCSQLYLQQLSNASVVLAFFPIPGFQVNIQADKSLEYSRNI